MSRKLTVAPTAGTKRSPAEIRYERLAKQVQTLKVRLREWAESKSAIARQDDILAEHHRELDAARARLIQVLDGVADSRQLTKLERKQLRDVLCELTYEVLLGGRHPELKAIYHRHARSDFDRDASAARGEQLRAMQAMAEAELGIDLGDEGFETVEDLGAAVRARLATGAADEVASAPKGPRVPPSSTRPTTQREATRQAKVARERTDASRALQEVYRRLARLLHPDREQDPTERDRKTALMQQVNVAYETADLLRLLELELQAEERVAAANREVAAERLKHFNRLLSDQVASLRDEVGAVEQFWRATLQVSKPTPKRVLVHLTREIQDVLVATREASADADRVHDPRYVKVWLLRNLVSIPDAFAAMFGE